MSENCHCLSQQYLVVPLILLSPKGFLQDQGNSKGAWEPWDKGEETCYKQNIHGG